jgi:hypothetical protein
MYVFDVETLGKESSAVILSMACVYFDPVKETSPNEMRKNAFFVKLDAQDQMKRLNRSITRSSLEWWAKQCENVKVKSFKPGDDDVTPEVGLELFRTWSKKYPDTKGEWVWARGNLDQLVLDSMEEKLGVDPVFHFNRWRDVRTGLDFLTGSDNGYCDVDYPGFDSHLHITKHDPVDDCILDAMMLMYGVKK